ncbi:hypothetical protein [Spirosoma lituiforme]
MLIKAKQIAPGILPSQIDLSTASTPSHPASRQFVADSVQQSIYNMDIKDSVKAATTANITLSAAQTIDGVSLVAGDRVLVKNQTTASANGIYIVNASSWVRSTDFDGSTEVTSQAIISVESGTTNANTTWRLTGTGPFTVNTSNLAFQLFSSAYYATPTISNKNMVASVTAADNDIACATGMAATPAQSSYVYVEVNGIAAAVGNAVKTADCYFSGDSGSTARALNAVVSGDKLYWVGSVAGHQLDANDRITFDYVV